MTDEPSSDAAPSPTPAAPAVQSQFATEVSLYLQYIVLSLAVKRALWTVLTATGQLLVDRIALANRRTLDVLGAKLWSFVSLAHERLGTLPSIRG